jgi:CyaY protein
MLESEFVSLADRVLADIEKELDVSEHDLDYATVGSGVLEIELDGGGKIVVNRHAAMQEIWVAARAGGFHFRWDGAVWRDTRDGRELMRVLAELISAAPIR